MDSQYLGRYRLGEIVPIILQTLDDSLTPTNPTNAPVAVVYDSSDSAVRSVKLPIMDQADVTGLFHYPLSLDNVFSAGTHEVIVHFTVGSTIKVVILSFEIVAGGDYDGSGIEMYYFRHPLRNYLLLQTDAGLIRKLRNPRAT